MFVIPYRWLPRTIIPNLSSMFWSVVYGVQNIIRWTPIIWFDDWIDFSCLAKIMEYKMRRDSKLFAEHGTLVNSDRTARELLICAELLKRLNEDSFDDLPRCMWKIHGTRMKEWEEMLGRQIGKHLRTWWD